MFKVSKFYKKEGRSGPLIVLRIIPARLQATSRDLVLTENYSSCVLGNFLIQNTCHKIRDYFSCKTKIIKRLLIFDFVCLMSRLQNYDI